MKLLSTKIYTTISLLVVSFDAYAYLDPGSLSMVVNIIIAGIVGAAVSVKIYWNIIKAWLMKTFSYSKSDDHL